VTGQQEAREATDARGNRDGHAGPPAARRGRDGNERHLLSSALCSRRHSERAAAGRLPARQQPSCGDDGYMLSQRAGPPPRCRSARRTPVAACSTSASRAVSLRPSSGTCAASGPAPRARASADRRAAGTPSRRRRSRSLTRRTRRPREPSATGLGGRASPRRPDRGSQPGCCATPRMLSEPVTGQTTERVPSPRRVRAVATTRARRQARPRRARPRAR